jgi:hypothetical protein
MGYSVWHTAAAFYSDNELYPKLIHELIQRVGEKHHIEAQTTTSAKSTALQTAVAMYNPVVVEALVNAGASIDGKDTANRTVLEYARQVHYKLVHGIDPSRGEERVTKLERITTIIVTLAKKAGWPGNLGFFQSVNRALDEADLLLQKMMLSEHQVAYMRKLETDILNTIGGSYANTLSQQGLDVMDLIRRVVMKRVKPALRMDLELRIFANADAPKPSASFDAVKSRIPWCRALQNNRLQEFQQAAAFEWLLDQVQRGTLPDDNPRLGVDGLVKFAISRQVEDLTPNSLIVRYPLTLLAWYEKTIMENDLILQREEMEQVRGFVAQLRQREAARARGRFPPPAWDEGFEQFHFVDLQPERLDIHKSVAGVTVVGRCRCYFDNLGTFSPFNMMRMCQRMSSIDAKVWTERLLDDRRHKLKDIDELTLWKESVGIPGGRSSTFSTMQEILYAERQGQIPSLLAYPGDVEDREEQAVHIEPTLLLDVMTLESRPTFPYKPIDFEKREIRLLRLVPAIEIGSTSGTIGKTNLFYPSDFQIMLSNLTVPMDVYSIRAVGRTDPNKQCFNRNHELTVFCRTSRMYD